jgi:hypothetical protein
MIDSANVYVSREVAAVGELYGDLVGAGAWTRPVGDQLRRQAERLATGHHERMPGALVELSNWHPELTDAGEHEIWSTVLSADDYLDAVAREHGFADGDAITPVAERLPDAGFEEAVEAVLAGDLESLSSLVTARPELVTARSHWAHRATLLHYASSNGVETHRQRVPLDLVDIITVLIERGADVNATAAMYGGGQTTLHLLLTSAHPRAAGVEAAAEAALRAAGAS